MSKTGDNDRVSNSNTSNDNAVMSELERDKWERSEIEKIGNVMDEFYDDYQKALTIQNTDDDYVINDQNVGLVMQEVVRRHPDLQHLRLSSMGISHFTTAGLPQLTWLSIEDCPLAAIDVSQSPDISSLDLIDNKLQRIDLVNNHAARLNVNLKGNPDIESILTSHKMRLSPRSDSIIGDHSRLEVKVDDCVDKNKIIAENNKALSERKRAEKGGGKPVKGDFTKKLAEQEQPAGPDEGRRHCW